MTSETKHDVRVLYVEDDATARDGLAQMLRRRCREVLTAENGQLGLELYRSANPDIVVSDIRMPAMDGLEMARQIRQRDTEVPIIFTTAHNDASYLLDCIDIGIDRFVIKPIESRQFLAAFERCTAIVTRKREVQRHHEEREKLIKDLQDALAKVKLLSGLIPICAACKKVRKDNGFWEQIEVYIRNHSEAEFTHGICPTCTERLYPGLLKNKNPAD